MDGEGGQLDFSLFPLGLFLLRDANFFFSSVALPRPSSTTRWQAQLVSLLRGSSSWVPPLGRRGEPLLKSRLMPSFDNILFCRRRRSYGGLATGELCQTSRGVELGRKKSV